MGPNRSFIDLNSSPEEEEENVFIMNILCCVTECFVVSSIHSRTTPHIICFQFSSLNINNAHQLNLPKHCLIQRSLISDHSHVGRGAFSVVYFMCTTFRELTVLSFFRTTLFIVLTLLLYVLLSRLRETNITFGTLSILRINANCREGILMVSI